MPVALFCQGITSLTMNKEDGAIGGSVFGPVPVSIVFCLHSIS